MALVHKHMDRDPLPCPSWVEPILDHSIEDIKDKYGNGWKKNDLRVFLSAPPPCVFSDDEKTAKETITKEEFEKLEKDKSMPPDWEKCPDEEYTYCFPLLGEYDWDKKKIILYIKNIEKYSERLDGDNSKEYLTKYVYTHELFHALFHYVTEQDPDRKHTYNYIGEIEEAMTEFCTLVFLNDFGDNDLFQFAKKEIKEKQKFVGILAAYGFGAYLYDDLNKDERYELINKYIKKLGYIDEFNLFVYLYRYMVRLRYKKECKELLEYILTNVHGSQVNTAGRRAIIGTMQIIANHINPHNNISSGYNIQRQILTDLFRNTSNSNYTKDAIMLRLTALDSSYSTNASKSYYAIEEMAEEIWNIPGNGINREDNANRFFNDVASGIQTASNNVHVDSWFNKQFGIQKNGKTGHRMTSLLSKYAYYCLLLDPNSDGFPIYDSLAVASFPFACMIVWPNTNTKYLKKNVKSFSSESNSQKYIPITRYIEAMNTLCVGLGLQNTTIPGFQKFDILDAYLWRMGKLSNGNLSLLLDKQGYEDIMDELSLKVNANDEKDAAYFGRMAKSFSNCLNKKISDINPCHHNKVTYPSMLANNICDKILIAQDLSKNTYTGNVNALVLYSLMSNPNRQFTLSDMRNQLYFNDIFCHWQKYYNR